MVELDPVNAGDSIRIGDESYTFSTQTAEEFNFWDELGRPVPFVYLPMRRADGKIVRIHASEIARAVDSQDSLGEK